MTIWPEKQKIFTIWPSYKNKQTKTKTPPQLSRSLNYRIAVIQERSNGGSDQGGSTDGSEKCLDSGYV